MIDHHEVFWKFMPRKELTQIYTSLALRSFGLSLIALFLPIYLHVELGFTMTKTLLVFMLYAVVFAIMSPVAAKFSARFGVKHSVLVSIPIHVVYLIMLYLAPGYNISALWLGVLPGLSLAFYWIGMHIAFFHASDQKHRGEEMGKRRAFVVVSATLGPLLGGWLIKFMGFPVVFAIASIILFLSALVLMLGKEAHVKYHFSFRKVLNKDHWKNSLYFVSSGSKVMANGVLWPLFIFMILGDYLSLGFIGALLAGLGAVLSWIVGRYSDKAGKRGVIRAITGFESLTWFLRALVQTGAHIFGITIFSAITNGIRDAPLGALEYDKAKGDVVAYFVSREVFVCLGRVLVLVVVMTLDSLASGFVFQGFINFASLLF